MCNRFQKTQLAAYFAVLVFALIGFAQRPGVRSTPADDLRFDMNQAQNAFLVANPNLERDLASAPVITLRREIAQSRELALKYTSAKVNYYKHLIEQTANHVDRFLSDRPPDPAVLDRQLTVNKDQRRLADAEIGGLKARVSAIEVRLNNASPSQRGAIQQELENAHEQIKVLEQIKSLLNGEFTDIQSIRDGMPVFEKARNALIKYKREEVEAYRQLQRLSEIGGEQYTDYFNALERLVSERDLNRKGRNN